MPTFLEVATTVPFDYEKAKEYTRSVEIPAFFISMAYVIAIFSIQAIMKNFKPFQLTSLLNFWNAWLAIFSIMGALMTGYGLSYEIYHRGLVSSYTHIGDYFTGYSGYWTFLFTMSKIAEFGDTIFIVLRKKPLIFLHWYHHVLTMNYAIISFSYDVAFNSWIGWMNFSVHSIMYGYYMLRSFGIRVPAWIARNITTMQIIQFVITLLILFHIGILSSSGVKVDSHPTIYWFCVIMEISYVMLFANFYFQSYIKGGGKKIPQRKKSIKESYSTDLDILFSLLI
ncbi:Elongation of very long chain fatty acids protein 6 [Parelaphostrongylus tenuis]|uniref:Elongation of very long chain fatty acids protein n=1 Tax=Parelaphostrongylus tenuis TaxID=148309 RepID=A0AAD5RIU1_PARTN|nr:Elongation of very long chain fatty acids protein 6 [Parelaphostrongylus tenuis]